MKVLPQTYFYFDISQQLPTFSYDISLVFYTLFSRRPVFVWQKFTGPVFLPLVSAVFAVVVLVNVQFSFGILPATFVPYISF